MNTLSFDSIVAVLSFIVLIGGAMAVFTKMLDRAKIDTEILTEMKISLKGLTVTTGDSNQRLKDLEQEMQKSKSWRENYTEDLDELIAFKGEQKLINNDTKNILATYEKILTSSQKRLEALEKKEKRDLKEGA